MVAWRNQRFFITGLIAMGLVVSGCSSEPNFGEETADDTITIGIKVDEPGLGFRQGSMEPRGFDIDVAKYVASELGYDEAQILWTQTPSSYRESALESGEVDIVVASFSITDERKTRVSFAGPYFVAGQDLLVRHDETGISSPEDLSGKRLCSVTGSSSSKVIKEQFESDITLVEQGGYAECITYLESSQVDAVTADDIVLAGLASYEQNRDKFRVVGEPFTVEQFGIGVSKDDIELCHSINVAITKMIEDGAWERSLRENTQGSSLEITKEPLQQIPMESCEG